MILQTIDESFQPMAFVILRPEGTQKWQGREPAFEEELIQFAKKKLPVFACPEWVSIVEELPKTS
jgi:acyl-coenzyme A synthetase/AMP-(fatty) acid ligase